LAPKNRKGPEQGGDLIEGAQWLAEICGKSALTGQGWQIGIGYREEIAAKIRFSQHAVF
jgi:hypothetical protein